MKSTKLIALLSFVMLHSVTLAAARIEPDLDPTSDKKFFGKDYPDDMRPGLIKEPIMNKVHKFSHPYPTVQDSDHYDKDYVEDANNDKGYWDAQMRYDKAKMAYLKQKKDVVAALKKVKKEEEDVVKAKEAELKAEKKAIAKEADEDTADKKHDVAEKEIEKTKTEVDKVTEDIEKEVTDIEECKKQLAAIRKKLKALVDERAEYERREKERLEFEKKKEAERVDKEKIEEEKEKKIPEEQKEYDDAVEQRKKEEADVIRVTAELKASAERLSVFRKADPDGGVYEVAKGAAWKSAALSGFAILMGALFLA